MQCLNPIIAYDKNYYRLKKYKLKVPSLVKADLKGFTNFKHLAQAFGDDYAMKEIKKPDVVLLPCRKCVNCQLNRSREWAIRNTLESREYDDGQMLFLTLTYDDEAFKNNTTRLFTYKDKNDIIREVPKLNVVDVQKFLKRLRKEFSKYKIRFYLAGEYGGQTYRPHYHICLYGLPISAIDDLDLLYEHNGNPYYTSSKIEQLWSLGFVNISTFSEYTAMYTARYCTKKQADTYSLNYCFNNNEFKKDFNTMSRNPGIAANYIITHKDDIYKHDQFIYHIDERTYELKPIAFFDRLYDIENPANMAFIKENRKKFYKAYEYFENLETDLSIAEYLNNEQRIGINKLKSRRN